MHFVDNPRPSTVSSAICLEMTRLKHSGDIVCVLSIPGRSGTLVHEYKATAGHRLSEEQQKLLVAAVVSTVEDWLLLAGAQQMLF